MDRQSITKEEAVTQLYQLGGRVLGKDIADVAAQAERVKSIFAKVGKLSGYVKDIVNTLSLLKDYTSGAYTQVPWRIVAALTGAVFYVFNPLDLIPDLVPLFGFADDATVFAAVMSFAKIDIASYLAWKADRGENIAGGGKSGIATIQKSEDITNWALTDFVEVVQTALRSMGNDSLFWCCCGADHISQNASNIIEKIMGGNGNINDVIGAIDMEAFQHCKEGFAFTRDRVYFRQFMGDSFSFAWREIVSIQYEGKELIINGMRLDNMCKDEKDANTVCKVLTAIANRADLTQEPEPLDESRYVPISEAIIKRFATVDGGGLLFTGNNIPHKKRMGAHKAMNIQEPPEDICLLFDISPLGSGKAGFALTSQAMYCKDFFTSPARREWGNYRWVANPTSFWLMFVNNQPYYEISGGTLNADQISAVVDALNEFQMYNLKEVGRSTEAKCKSVLEQIDACEKLVDQVSNEREDINAADEEAEKDPLKSANSVEGPGIDDDDKTVAAAGIRKKLWHGRRMLVSASVERGNFAIRSGKYYLNEIITIGAEAQLVMKDADMTFGPKGRIVFSGGKGDISNCKFACAKEDESESFAVGSVMFSGKGKWVAFNHCNFDGKGSMAGAILDGDTTFFRCRIENLVNKKQSGSVLGTSYLKGAVSKFALKSTSIENCRAESQAVVWAMDLNVRDCEFVNCSSPLSIITVVEDCSVSVWNSVFDHCAVEAGGAIVSFYSNGGSNNTGGCGIDNCLLKNCSYQYSHNVHIPLAMNSWVTEDIYCRTPDDPLRPFFLRNGSSLSKPIGADLNLPDEMELETEIGVAEDDDTPNGSENTKKAKKHRPRVAKKTVSKADNTKDSVKQETKQRSGSEKKTMRTRNQKSLTLGDSENDNEISSQKGSSKNSSRLEAETDAATALTSTASKGRNGSGKTSSAKKKSEKSACVAPKTRIQAGGKVEDDVTNVKAKKPTTKTKPSVVERISVGDAVRKSIADANESNIYVGEAIPTKKLNNAAACMGVRVGEDVYALIDTTWFGSGKTGLIFTSIGIRWKNDWTTDTVKTMLQWSEVKEVLPKATCEKYDLRFSDDAVVNLAGSSIEPKALKAILERVSALVG